jgi:hypothetical protein
MRATFDHAITIALVLARSIWSMLLHENQYTTGRLNTPLHSAIATREQGFFQTLPYSENAAWGLLPSP